MLSPKETGYRWLWAYGYDDWVIRFRNLDYPELKREMNCTCAENVLGLCDHNHRVIWIQEGMRNTQALDTIYHELAHVFSPGQTHGPVWKDWYDYIKTYGLPENIPEAPARPLERTRTHSKQKVRVKSRDNGDLGLMILLTAWMWR